MAKKNFESLYDLLKMFPDEQTCIEYYEYERWHGKVVSPFDPDSVVYKCKNNRYKCKNTGKYFNVKTGTLFDNTKIPLQKWFIALYLEKNHKKGISSYQLAKDIKVQQRTAWFMLQRIRNCDKKKEDDVRLKNEVEVDETYIGGKAKNKHKNKKKKGTRGRSTKDKTPVFGLIERGGRVVAKVVDDTTKATLVPIIQKTVKDDVVIYSDEWKAYVNLGKLYHHEVVKHKNGEYVNGDASTNGIENYWSHLKRMILGIHHWVSPKHLQLYVDGQTFRHNTRNLSLCERFNLTLQNANQRLKYKELINGVYKQ